MYLLVCLVFLGLRLAAQGIGVAEGHDVDSLHQTVPHPELNVRLDGVAAAGVCHPLFRVAGGQGPLAEHAHDDAAVGHAGCLGDIHPDHILKQFEQGLRAAGMERFGRLRTFGHKAGAGGDPLLEILFLDQILHGAVLKHAEARFPQVVHCELVARSLDERCI